MAKGKMRCALLFSPILQSVDLLALRETIVFINRFCLFRSVHHVQDLDRGHLRPESKSGFRIDLGQHGR